MKKTLSLIMVFTLILTLMVPAMGASILTATASANPTRYLDFNPMNSGDVTKGFMNIGGNTMTMVNGKLEVVPGGAGTGLYYGPASEYGGPGNGKIYNGLLSFNYAVDFKAGANDWGSTIQFRTNNANPPWAMSSGFYLLIRPDMIILYKVGGVFLM